MLAAVFSFRGRINRLQYFLSYLALSAVVGVPVVLILALSATQAGGISSGGLGLIGLVLLPLLALLCWVGLSLEARRFRDIGWNPLYAILGFVGADIVDRVVEHGVAGLSVQSAVLQHGSVVSALINLTMVGLLLFWPSAPEGGREPTIQTGFRGPNSSFAGTSARTIPQAFSAGANRSAWNAASLNLQFWGLVALLFAAVFTTALAVITHTG